MRHGFLRGCGDLRVDMDSDGVRSGNEPGAGGASDRASREHRARPPRAVRRPPSPGSARARRLPGGRFGTVTVYLPSGTAQSVAIFLSGDGGWQLGVIPMARALADMGAVVIGVDVRRYLASLHAARKGASPCQLIAGDFENLSHRIQKQLGLREYHVPVLVGYSSGATVVYAVLVQSPPGTFAGALSLGFCADQDFRWRGTLPGRRTSLHAAGAGTSWSSSRANVAHSRGSRCKGSRMQVCAPPAVDAFVARTSEAQIVRLPKVGHGFGVERNWLPQFRTAYQSIVERVNAPRALRPAPISDLPVNEVHAAGHEADEFALLLSGDGGWAGLDQELAARLAASGVPTVGLNSLKYFWRRRTPDEAARDVGRVISHYLATWHKSRVLLVGYSFGADVLPFIVNRLPEELRQRIATVSLLGLDANASFEISVSDWIGEDERGPATQPELAALAATPVLCIYGGGEKDTICPSLSGPQVSREEVGSGHHFSGEYAQLADRIMAFARDAKPIT